MPGRLTQCLCLSFKTGFGLSGGSAASIVAATGQVGRAFAAVSIRKRASEQTLMGMHRYAGLLKTGLDMENDIAKKEMEFIEKLIELIGMEELACKVLKLSVSVGNEKMADSAREMLLHTTARIAAMGTARSKAEVSVAAPPRIGMAVLISK